MAEQVLLRDETPRQLLRQLLSSRRLEILWHLSKGAMEVNQIADAVGMSGSQMSTYLRQWHAHGFVRCQTEGRTHFYSLSPAVTIEVAEDRLKMTLDVGSNSDLVVAIPR